MIRAIATEIAVCSVKIAAFLIVLYVFGTFAGCGGSVADEPDDPKMTIEPVLCLPSDAGSHGCAK